MEFSTKTLKQFYLNMPQSFMGLPGRGESRIESSQHAAIVRKAACSNSTQAGEFWSWGFEDCSYLSWQRNPAPQLMIYDTVLFIRCTMTMILWIDPTTDHIVPLPRAQDCPQLVSTYACGVLKVEILLVSAQNLHIFEELDQLDSLQHPAATIFFWMQMMSCCHFLVRILESE